MVDQGQKLVAELLPVCYDSEWTAAADLLWNYLSGPSQGRSSEREICRNITKQML